MQRVVEMHPNHEKYRQEFERLTPDSLRLRMETRAAQFSGEYARAAEDWLLEQQANADAIEAARFRSIRKWTILAAVAGTVAAVAAGIAAGPIVKGWLP
jgi:hypothetical protein